MEQLNDFLPSWIDVMCLVKFPLLWKFVITNGTLEWFLVLMHCCNVLSQVPLLWTIVITNGTLEWFLALMNWCNVLSQTPLAWTVVITNGTLEWFFALMNWWNMKMQCLFPWKLIISLHIHNFLFMMWRVFFARNSSKLFQFGALKIVYGFYVNIPRCCCGKRFGDSFQSLFRLSISNCHQQVMKCIWSRTW